MKAHIAAMAALLALAGSAAAQSAAPAPKLTALADEAVSGNDKLHAIMAFADWPVGSATAKHFHEGDEYAIVLEGAIEVDNEGQPPKVYKAGEAYHNARGVVHVAKNANNGPSRTAIVLVIDKGAPPQTMVK